MQQKDQYIDIRNSGIRISVFATVAIIIVFMLYGYAISPVNIGVISSRVNQSMANLGMAVILFLIGSLAVIGHGIYRICTSEKIKMKIGTQFTPINVKTKDNNRSSGIILSLSLAIIADIISQRKIYQLVFFIVLLTYALLFAFVSQIIIFRPDVSFSHVYQVKIPSWLITPCCNVPGLVPTFTAYLSDNLIIFIIPINLILTVVISTLVSVNVTLALYIFQNKNNNSNNSNSKSTKNNNFSCFSGIGATTGLFTACPTCAGTFFSGVLGTIITAAGISGPLSSTAIGITTFTTATAILAPFQLLFIIISIVILLLSPYLTIKSKVQKRYYYISK